jgi:5S rRNA maturation endonuclease (ribonuclease M5)
VADLFDDEQAREIYSPRRDYRYPDGRVVHRKPNKDFPQTGNTKGNSLFHADRIGEASHVYVVEGEKDCEAIELAGGVAVCSAMGAGKAHLADWSTLRGKTVTVVADKDDPGRKHAEQVAEILTGAAESVRLVEAVIGKDLADHVAAGKTLDELVELVVDARPDGNESVFDGAELLDDIREFLSRFVVYPSVHELVAHTLWIAHAWFMGVWDSTPRIAFLSPEPGSGKSRALEVTEPLVPRPVHAVNCTPAYLFRKISDEAWPPTILYDEVDTIFGPKAREHEEIRGVLNAGHRKGATAGRCVLRGKIVETEELPAYCAVALAGLDDLPDTLMTRSVICRMRRRAPTEQIQPWRKRVNGAEAGQLYKRLLAWSGNVEPLKDGWPTLPDAVTDRDADVWESLIAVADLAGGDWPKAARVAAVTAVTASRGRKPSVGVLLLHDIRAVFSVVGRDRMSTADILNGLNRIEESPWPTIRRGEALDPRGLANRLSKYGIGSKALRVNDEVIKGYSRAQFEDAWSRYLTDDATPASGQSAVTAVTNETSQVNNDADLFSAAKDVTDDRLHGYTVTRPKQGVTSGETAVTDVTEFSETQGESAPRRPGCVCIGQPSPCFYCQQHGRKGEAS